MCRWAVAYPETYWDTRTIVAHYLVTMDIETADPLLPIDRLAEVVREAILPSLKTLTELKARGKVVTGGYPVGERFLVMVVEADSEEELQEVLDELPLSDVAKVKASPLRGFGEFRHSR
jgi:muconolactone delta-isomerase